jgi:hypothetical protein
VARSRSRAKAGKKVSAKAAVELPLTDATQGPPQPDNPAPEQQWQLNLKNKANDAISAEACWTREYGEWRTFAVPSDAVKLARLAAAAWSKIADDGAERTATADETARRPQPSGC